MSPYNSFVCGPKFTNFFIQRRRSCSWWNTFQICDTLSRFGDIRDQSGKLSKIAPNFGRFFLSSQILGGRPSKAYTDFITPDSRHIIWKKFCEDTPTSPEVIGAHTLNCKINFKFTGLKFSGGTPLPLRMCASSAWPICSACKNFRAQHPLMAEI